MIARRPRFRRRFVGVGPLLTELKQRMRPDWSPGRDEDGELDRTDPLEQAKAAPFLILDDLGREKGTESAVATLFELVDARYNEGRLSVVTTNYTPNQLAFRGYEAIVSRLVEDSDVVKIDASDYRLVRRP